MKNSSLYYNPLRTHFSAGESQLNSRTSASCGMKNYLLILRILFLIFSLIGPGLNCTNYSAEDAIMVNIPIITDITTNGTGGHLIVMAAQNAEVGFARNYRIFEGASEYAVFTAAPGTGTDCSFPLYILPTQGIPYRIEVDPLAGMPIDNTLNIVCTASISLTPGNYVAIRPLKYGDLFKITTGLSSNAVLIP